MSPITRLSESGRPTLRDGYFYHQGRPFSPIGFNYWPSRTGVYCWRRFNLAEWEEDFQEIARRGYNTVRFFLLWPDFQPEEDRIDPEKIAQLRQVIAIGAKHGLWLVPTLFQGWMSGTNFDPEWRKGRNHIMDLEMRQAMTLLTREVCEAIKGFDNLLALDLANEIDAICKVVTPETVYAWTSELKAVSQSIIPDLLVTNGTAVTPTRSNCPWGFGYQDVDFQCMHGYPVFWNPLPVGSLASVRAATVFGSMTAFAGAYGPVMREEYGTAIGGDGPLIASFIKTSTFATYLAGANGFLYWCWRDFSNREHPYQKDPFESSMGYLDASLEPKEWGAGLDEFRDFLASHQGWTPRPDSIGIYIPNQFKGIGPSADEALASAYENLVAVGCLPRFTPRIDSSFRLLVLPVTELNLDEIDALQTFVDEGGKVIALGVTNKTCSRQWEALTDTRQEDVFRSLKPLKLAMSKQHGEVLIAPPARWSPPWPILRPTVGGSASVCLESDGVPRVLLTKRGGQSRIVQTHFPLINPELEIQTAHVAFWRGLLDLVAEEPRFVSSCPALQCAEIVNGDGLRKILVINHGMEPVQTELTHAGCTINLDLAGRDILLLDASTLEVPQGELAATMPEGA